MKDDALLYELAHAAQQKAARARRRKTRSAAPRRLVGPVALSPSQKTGYRAEDRACQYLQARGLIVLGRNLRSATGEIDLVANDGGILAFIEVRHRHTRQYGGAAASVNRQKQQRLIRTAHYLLPQLAGRFFGGRPPACRFDVVSIEPGGLTWIQNAFDMR